MSEEITDNNSGVYRKLSWLYRNYRPIRSESHQLMDDQFHIAGIVVGLVSACLITIGTINIIANLEFVWILGIIVGSIGLTFSQSLSSVLDTEE